MLLDKMNILNNKPRISIVIPVYNGESFLKETLDSIKNQLFTDFEAIIVNNGSTDNSLKILKNYAKKDKRFIIKNLKEANAVKAANYGLGFAKGKYISKMDADDVYLPEKLQVQFDYLEKHPEIFLVGTSAIVINEKSEKIGVFRKYNSYRKIRRKLMKSNPFVHSSIMYKNMKGLFYRDKFVISEEYDLYLRLLGKGKRLTNLPNFLVKYRIRGNSLVSTKPHQLFYFNKAKEFYLQRKKYGKDDYENLRPPLKEEKQQPFGKLSLQIKIFAEFQDNQVENVRKDIKEYFNKYGFNKSFVLYYVLSFFPSGLITLLREIF